MARTIPNVGDINGTLMDAIRSGVSATASNVALMATGANCTASIKQDDCQLSFNGNVTDGWMTESDIGTDIWIQVGFDHDYVIARGRFLLKGVLNIRVRLWTNFSELEIYNVSIGIGNIQSDLTCIALGVHIKGSEVWLEISTKT